MVKGFKFPFSDTLRPRRSFFYLNILGTNIFCYSSSIVQQLPKKLSSIHSLVYRDCMLCSHFCFFTQMISRIKKLLHHIFREWCQSGKSVHLPHGHSRFDHRRAHHPLSLRMETPACQLPRNRLIDQRCMKYLFNPSGLKFVSTSLRLTETASGFRTPVIALPPVISEPAAQY